MLFKTHFAIVIFFILLLLPNIKSKFIFVIVVLISTQLPDLDSSYSKFGRRKLARILQIFTKHRGIVHSFTFLLSLTFILILFLPTLGFGFFLGYGIHLFADSFTIEGIRPFYPSKTKSWGRIKTGGKIEIILFLLFVSLDIFLFFIRFL